MKFSLIFVLCLVCYGATYQWPQYRNYRTFYEPRLAFYYPALANQDFYLSDLNEADYSSVSGPSDYADTEARGPVRGNEKQQSRLFGLNNLLSQLINNNNPVTIFPQTTFTSTVLQTSTSTITTTSIKSCIATSLFNGAANAKSTTPCARRRRGIDIEAIEAFEALIGPTPVEPLEKSVAPVLASSSRDGRSDYQAETIEIVSSQGHQASEEDQRSTNRQKRSVVTVTSTVTAYTFVGTNVTKFFNLVAAPAKEGDPGTLNCLPPGYNVC